MAKKKGNLYGKAIEYTRTENGTSIGRRPKTSSMNKHKRRIRGRKKYRGQGKWTRGQTSMQMERWLILDYHKILDHHKAEVVVVIVVNKAIKDHQESELDVFDELEEDTIENYEEEEKVTTVAIEKFLLGEVKWSKPY